MQEIQVHEIATTITLIPHLSFYLPFSVYLRSPVSGTQGCYEYCICWFISLRLSLGLEYYLEGTWTVSVE